MVAHVHITVYLAPIGHMILCYGKGMAPGTAARWETSMQECPMYHPLPQPTASSQVVVLHFAEGRVNTPKAAGRTSRLPVCFYDISSCHQ